jgi:hypothetical protein
MGNELLCVFIVAFEEAVSKLTFALQIEPRSTCGCLRTRRLEADLQPQCGEVR